MAGGSYRKKSISQEEPLQIFIPRATRQMVAVPPPNTEEPTTQVIRTTSPARFAAPTTQKRFHPALIIDDVVEHPLKKHRRWLSIWILSSIFVIIGLVVLVSAGIFQRSGSTFIPDVPGQLFNIQVGGSLDDVNAWQKSNGPLPAATPLPKHVGPYAVLGKPTLTADFMNQVLASYGSPAAGTGKALYDYGVQYGIDPAFALAFFMHESGFGATGVAQQTLSLGNIRCITERPCLQTPGNGGFAIMSSWEDGYQEWYKLIRNLYVARWGLVTVDQIIPVYAPASDHNDEADYIASLKRAIDTWHSGQIRA